MNKRQTAVAWFVSFIFLMIRGVRFFSDARLYYTRTLLIRIRRQCQVIGIWQLVCCGLGLGPIGNWPYLVVKWGFGHLALVFLLSCSLSLFLFLLLFLVLVAGSGLGLGLGLWGGVWRGCRYRGGELEFTLVVSLLQQIMK
jgi:hypothetical protein